MSAPLRVDRHRGVLNLILREGHASDKMRVILILRIRSPPCSTKKTRVAEREGECSNKSALTLRASCAR